jgi:transposase
MKKYMIGIDVSKEKVDLCLTCGGKVLKEWVVENSMTSITRALKELSKEHGISLEEVLLCAEYTGQYTYPLCCVCEDKGIDLWLENPAQIKLRSGVQRGKNDKLDARKIAAYAARFEDKARLFSLPEKVIASLKQLIAERDMYVMDKAKYQGQLTDQKRFMAKKDYEIKSKRLKQLIKKLEEAIEQIEEQIKDFIDDDPTLSRQHELLVSIDGVGDQTAVKMIVTTNMFRNFDDPRRFCCYAGCAPFEYSSGSSIRSSRRVSHRADKSVKKILHMAALTAATRIKGELHDYYERKVAEGKNKMSVLNAVRAKLVHRMFAVIKNDQLYQKKYLNCLA